jgi:hypothetical protein
MHTWLEIEYDILVYFCTYFTNFNTFLSFSSTHKLAGQIVVKGSAKASVKGCVDCSAKGFCKEYYGKEHWQPGIERRTHDCLNLFLYNP